MEKRKSILFKEKILIILIIIAALIPNIQWIGYSKIINYFSEKKSLDNKKNNIYEKKLITDIKSLDKINVIEKRFENLYKQIDLSKKIGYITDLNGRFDGVRNFQYAQYSLSPAVLDERYYDGIILGNFSDKKIIGKIKSNNYFFCKKNDKNKTEDDISIADLKKIKNSLILYAPKLVTVQGYYKYNESYRCSKNTKIIILEHIGDGLVFLRIE